MRYRMESIKDRIFVGVDLHKDTLTAAVLQPQTGEVTYAKISCKCRDKIVEFFASLPKPNVVAIEAVGFYRWLWESLEPVVSELVLADATQCRALAGRRIKTDREDAANVAELLASGRLPRAWAPPPLIAHLRDQTRHRRYLMQQHARVLHRVKAIMNMLNRPGPSRMKAPALIKYIKAQREKLPAHFVQQLEMAADELVMLERHLDRIDMQLKAQLSSGPLQPAADRLRSFPGVGVVVAATILAEVGDFDRFETRESIARYAGLNPRVYCSSETVRTGRIAKAGSRDLRWALVQASWVAVRCDEKIKAKWLRLKKRMGGKKAIIAIARRMLRWMWSVQRSGRNYQQVQHAA